jgi:serine/threonine-protein kinase HipA
MNTVAKVLFNQRLVGYLSKTLSGYSFKYDEKFLNASDSFPIAYNFPLRAIEYRSERLFPFFESLTSEGWLLKIQSQSMKIDERDYFSMLLENGKDLIGGITIERMKSHGNL